MNVRTPLQNERQLLGSETKCCSNLFGIPRLVRVQPEQLRLIFRVDETKGVRDIPQAGRCVGGNVTRLVLVVQCQVHLAPQRLRWLSADIGLGAVRPLRLERPIGHQAVRHDLGPVVLNLFNGVRIHVHKREYVCEKVTHCVHVGVQQRSSQGVLTSEQADQTQNNRVHCHDEIVLGKSGVHILLPIVRIVYAIGDLLSRVGKLNVHFLLALPVYVRADRLNVRNGAVEDKVIVVGKVVKGVVHVDRGQGHIHSLVAQVDPGII
mmetsp:Transcript_24776/g.69402  ORF Transcript_24776/g.69402 Transcript_24776/m.69402 type:complete len:264 (+) Transcript_24776:1696-2487(+)